MTNVHLHGLSCRFHFKHILISLASVLHAIKKHEMGKERIINRRLRESVGVVEGRVRHVYFCTFLHRGLHEHEVGQLQQSQGNSTGVRATSLSCVSSTKLVGRTHVRFPVSLQVVQRLLQRV
jgi:hypothetical protein